MKPTFIKTSYKGITKIISNNLLDEIVENVNPPKKSNKFATPALYYKGIYYFYEDVQKTINEICKEEEERSTYRNSNIWEKLHKGWVFSISIGFYNHKWIQDREYITKEFKEFLFGYI